MVDFYRILLVNATTDLYGIDKCAMREGTQLNSAQRDMLIMPVMETEIVKALKGIGNDKSPGSDGFGAYFFKKTWHIIKGDVVKAIQDFFTNNMMYKVVNCSIVTLITKHNGIKGIKDYI